MKTETKPSDAHLLRDWTSYAMFRCWIHARKYCDDMADSDRKNNYRVMIRHGWYIVERKRDPDAD